MPMPRADEPLVRCNMAASSKRELREIMARTGERMWEILKRLVRAEWERLLGASSEASPSSE